jgi:hypothetical protein
MRKKKIEIELTELFMAKCGRKGWDRCFHGTIRREQDKNGNPVVYGKIKVGEGYIIASARDQWILGEQLDEMVELILVNRIHQIHPMTSLLAGELYYHN